jgi:hypothetical protein
LTKDVIQGDLGVTIPLVFGGLFPVLNRFLGAPLQAGEALLASVKPHRFLIYHFDIVRRADFGADSTAIAFIVHPEILVHFVDLPKRHFIEPGKEDILPKRSSVHPFSLTSEYGAGNGLHHFPGFAEESLLSLDWSGTAPWDVIGRQDNGITQGK